MAGEGASTGDRRSRWYVRLRTCLPCERSETRDDDAELLRVAVRDPGAFDVVYRRYQRAVATYVARRIGAEGVEDVTAEVFVRAFRVRAAYTPVHDSALPRLLGIASGDL
jgi:hypothetical protein